MQGEAEEEGMFTPACVCMFVYFTNYMIKVLHRFASYFTRGSGTNQPRTESVLVQIQIWIKSRIEFHETWCVRVCR